MSKLSCQVMTVTGFHKTRIGRGLQGDVSHQIGWGFPVRWFRHMGMDRHRQQGDVEKGCLTTI
jgi:hypothetical protein